MSNEQPLLQTFWALTKNGVWEVKIERHHTTQPIVRLIRTRASVNGSLPEGSMLEGGSYVAISPNYLALYYPTTIPSNGTVKIFPIEEMSDEAIGDHTGEMYACFLLKEDALLANEKPSLDHARSDYEEQTKATLRRIGPNHPVFIISRNNPFAFSILMYREIGINQSSVPIFPRSQQNFGMVIEEEIVRDTSKQKRESSRAPVKSISRIGEEGLPSKEEVDRFAFKQAMKARGRVVDAPKPPTPLPVAERPVAVIPPTPHTVQHLLRTRTQTFNLPKGKYEMQLVPCPINGNPGGSWYIVKSMAPRIIGLSAAAWSIWFNTTCMNRVERTHVDDELFFEIFADRLVKEAL